MARRMWNLSAEALEIVHQLNDLRTSKSRSKRSLREENICALLGQLADLEEPAALPNAALLLLEPSENVRASARSTVSQLVSVLAPNELIQIYDYFNGFDSWCLLGDWHRLDPSDVAIVAGERSGHCQSSVLGLLSFHRNGFVRHKALRLLSQCLDGSEFPFLVIRQNDWVPSIAQEAQEAVSERINDAYLTHIVRSLRLIMHLMSYRRHDFQGVVRKVVDLLLCERHSEILRAAIGSSDPMVRRQVVRIGLEATGTYQARLVAFGVDSDDPIIRLQCCQHAATAFEPNQLRVVLRRLTADQFMPVRRAALVVQADQFPHLACNTWQQALFDCSRSIRELARFSLERLGYTEFANNYRDVIAKQPSSLAALQGLAETGEASDTELFLDLLRHSFPSRRICRDQRSCSYLKRICGARNRTPTWRHQCPSHSRGDQGRRTGLAFDCR